MSPGRGEKGGEECGWDQAVMRRRARLGNWERRGGWEKLGKISGESRRDRGSGGGGEVGCAVCSIVCSMKGWHRW